MVFACVVFVAAAILDGVGRASEGQEHEEGQPKREAALRPRFSLGDASGGGGFDMNRSWRTSNSVTNKSWKKAVRLYNQSICIRPEQHGKSVNRDLLIPGNNFQCGFHMTQYTLATNL